MQRMIDVSAFLMVSVVTGGCKQAPCLSPEPPGGAKARQEPALTTSAPRTRVAPEESDDASAPQRPSSALDGARSALATPNAANGCIEIVLTDLPAPCGPHRPFPATCDPAWRVRIDLMPEHQRPGRYALGPELAPFSYRDAQGKAGGIWQEGAQCKNLGAPFVGSLEILAIDATSITGILSGAGEADGPFRAQRCPACNGTGMACTSNAECCNDFCHEGRCQP
jgi:hypothetical protein